MATNENTRHTVEIDVRTLHRMTSTLEQAIGGGEISAYPADHEALETAKNELGDDYPYFQ